MFKKILIANRGEIAVRIMRTAREMGISTVAVYSDVDATALHTQSADQAVALGDPDPTQSYLNIDKILDAAKQTGAEAIHPGYGFLSENATFADRVKQAGLVFIGPPAKAIRELGDKTTARQMMEKSGVPIIPGTTKGQAPAELVPIAKKMGYPVLIKAAAGGGGKGMRVVENPDDLVESAEQASSEAQNAFGDGTIYIEKYLAKPRHVEVQVLADSHGNVVHLYERECSIQRRHQKIIEETPSVALDDTLRQQMGEAACAAVKTAGYENAGTVEFLLDPDGKFYFLEVNTRLQVEHPITEMITGIDLVRAQLEIAAGGKLPFTQSEIPRNGHSIECRLYAEDPEADFMPYPGKILFMKAPSGPGVRLDNGVYSGFEVPVHYDPILGKLIVWAENRPAAIERMILALTDCPVLGVKTQIEFMIDVLGSEPFVKGETHTHFIEEHFANWTSDATANGPARAGFVLAQGALPKVTATAQGDGAGTFVTPWQTLGSWDLGK
jgi:acetyl-CoA carboxylase biotin carboxylase subunit